MKYQAVVSYVMWEEDDPDTVDLVVEFPGGVTKILTVSVVKEKENVRVARQVSGKKKRLSTSSSRQEART